MNNTVVSTLDLRELFEAIPASLRRVMKHDYASLYDSESSQLRLPALDSSAVPVEDIPAGLAFTLRQPVMVHHLSFEQFPSGHYRTPARKEAWAVV